VNNEYRAQSVGYEGPAELVWGSWVIEGRAWVKERTCETAPVGPSGGISPFPDDAEGESLVGAFTADSGTEPSLLSSLATALGETYRLRWRRQGRDEDLPVTVTARHGNRVHFETRI
jgi:hypothetical protein